MERFTFVSLGLLVVALSLTGARCCRNGWFPKNRFCYKVFNEQKNWNDAEMFCRNHGTDCHLASIHSREESTDLAQYVSEHLRSGGNVWIGLNDLKQKNQWEWTDSSRTNYVAWARHEPDPLEEDEFCVQLKQGSGYFDWSNSECEKLKPFLCKCP